MIKAVLFDMDGVLFDTESLGERLMTRLCAERGYTIDSAFYRAGMGIPNEEGIAYYQARLGADYPHAEVAREFEAYFHALGRRGEIPRKDGVLECLEGLRKRGMVLAIATGTVRALLNEYLDRMPDIAAYFRQPDGTIRACCGGEAERGKPSPDTYLLAAERAGFPPEECLGVEDSLNGVKAIRGSGAYSVLVPDLLPYSQAFAPYVDTTLGTLRELCPLIDRLNAAPCADKR